MTHRVGWPCFLEIERLIVKLCIIVDKHFFKESRQLNVKENLTIKDHGQMNEGSLDVAEAVQSDKMAA